MRTTLSLSPSLFLEIPVLVSSAIARRQKGQRTKSRTLLGLVDFAGKINSWSGSVFSPPKPLGHGRFRIGRLRVNPSSWYIFGLKRKMSSMVARRGRHRQRYEDNLRLVSGCIPYRLIKDTNHHGGSIENRIEVLMVSCPDRDDLVFPKGGWEDDETVEEAAHREALEEVGVRGVLNETPLGIWEFRSKSSQDICGLEGGCRGYMFSLEVTEELEAWPEQENHFRRWVSVKEAFELCRYEWMCQALKSFLRVLAEMAKLDVIGESPESPLPADVVADTSIMPAQLLHKCPTVQHHTAKVPFSWFVTVKRLPLT